MAFVDPQDPSQQQPQAPVAGQQTDPVSSGGAGAVGVSKQAATPGQNVPAMPSAQLNAYLTANAPQAQQMAANVAGQIGNQISSTQNAIQPAVNTYTGNIYNVPTDTTTNQAVATSPSSLTPQQQASYQQELGAASQAPNAAATFETTQPYQNLTSQIQNNVDQANLWNSGNNIPNLTTAFQNFEPGNATSGDATLDALLLSQTPSAYNQITQATAPAANLQSYLNSGAAQADQALQNAIAQDTATTQAANQSAGQFVTGLNTTLQGYLANAQQQANAYNQNVDAINAGVASAIPLYQTFQNDVGAFNNLVNNPGSGNNQLSGPLAALLEAIPTAPQPTANNPMAPTPTIANVATPQNFTDIQALQNLIGANALTSLAPSINSSMTGAPQFQLPNGTLVPSQIFKQALNAPDAAMTQDTSAINGSVLSQLPFVTTPFNSVVSAYNALMNSILPGSPGLATANPSQGGTTAPVAPGTPQAGASGLSLSQNLLEGLYAMTGANTTQPQTFNTTDASTGNPVIIVVNPNGAVTAVDQSGNSVNMTEADLITTLENATALPTTGNIYRAI